MDFSNINLINWIVTFLLIAIVAGVLGFGGLSGTAMSAAKLLCGVALTLVVLAVILRLLQS
jgi:uncharacterized membrane protein YtjA (UPF0391 family)